MAFDKVIKEAEASLKTVALPVDYKMEFTGEELKRKESMSNLTFALYPFTGACFHGACRTV